MDSRRGRQKPLIFLVEPHPLAARYLRTTLERDHLLELIPPGNLFPGEALQQNGTCLVLIDADALPVPLGAYLHVLRPRLKEARILVIGRPVSDDELCRLLFLGVDGYISYNEIDRQICNAVRGLAEGHLWVAPNVLERYVRLSSTSSRLKENQHRQLTLREREIFELLQRRLTNKEIGSVLGIGERTVRFHIQNIFDKIGVRDRRSVADLTGHVGPSAGGMPSVVQPPLARTIHAGVR